MRKRYRVLNVLICIVLAASIAGAASAETVGKYVDDSVITTKVKAAIAQDPSLSVFQVNVTTYEGVVQLSGFVDSKEVKEKAEQVAGKVEGVKSVKNDLIVK